MIRTGSVGGFQSGFKGGGGVGLPSFMPKIKAGAANLVDMASGVAATNAISGVRYGIVNGIVTEFGVNQPALEDDGLRGCPAFTQLTKMSETPSDSEWYLWQVAVSAATAYQGMAMWKLTETVAYGPFFLRNNAFYSGVADNAIIGAAMVVKAGERTTLAIGAFQKNGSYITPSIVDLATGAVTAKGGFTDVSIQSLGAGYYRVFCFFNCLSGGSIPEINWYIAKDTSTQFYQGDGVSGIYVGQPTHVNFGVNGKPFVPPYVPNNTTGSISVVSEAATATNGTSFDLDNALLARLKAALRGPNAQGHLELTFKSNIDSGWLPNDTNLNIFSLKNNSQIFLYLRKDFDGSLNFALQDGGLNLAKGVVSSVSVGQIFKISLDWGTHSTGQKMRLTVNGVKTTLVNFTGSFGTQDLRFFYDNAIHAGWIKKDSLKIYDRPRW